MKKIITLIAVLALAGCATNPNKIEITSNVKPIAVPIIYSPAPPVVERPALPHLNLTPDQILSDGEVAKAYAASVQALIGYAEQLEDVVKQYKDIHDAYGSLASKVAEDWKAKTGTELQVPPPPTDAVTAKKPEEVRDAFKDKPAPAETPPKLVVPPTTLH